jgi:ProP effector
MSTTASAQEAQATPGPSKRKIAKLARRRAITSVLVLLAEIWPQCFFLHQIRRRPLKIGILGDAIAALDGAVSPLAVKQAIGSYCINKVYRNRVVAGAVRIGLDGEAAGIVTEKEAAHTAEVTRRRLDKLAAKSKPAKPKRISFADLKHAAMQRAAKETTNQKRSSNERATAARK